MSPDDDTPGSARSVAEISEQIRNLWLRADRRLTAGEGAEYEQMRSTSPHIGGEDRAR
ncbi:hypothetical protein OHB54_01760 [Streptomyces sp. NBC_01007]|nr:hypothetical protein OHB54_01760 [Streptomyces sp. NBC_01007]